MKLIRQNKWFATAMAILLLSLQLCHAQVGGNWKTADTSAGILGELDILRSRNRALYELTEVVLTEKTTKKGRKLKTITSGLQTTSEIEYDYFLGSSNNPQWLGTKEMPGGKVLFHDREGKEFTAILAARKEFTSRCRKPGEPTNYTFMQVIHGKWLNGEKGYELTHFTVPLQGPREFGDIRYEDVERFNHLVVYNDYRDSVAATPELKWLAGTIAKYEKDKGTEAWRERSVGGEAQMTKCDALPVASKTTNQ